MLRQKREARNKNRWGVAPNKGKTTPPSTMFIYLASTPAWQIPGTLQIGCTRDVNGRRALFRELCPPDAGDAYHIYFLAIWETTAETEEELRAQLEEVHQRFRAARLEGSNWFRVGQWRGLVDRFIDGREWVRRVVERQ